MKKVSIKSFLLLFFTSLFYFSFLLLFLLLPLVEVRAMGFGKCISYVEAKKGSDSIIYDDLKCSLFYDKKMVGTGRDAKEIKYYFYEGLITRKETGKSPTPVKITMSIDDPLIEGVVRKPIILTIDEKTYTVVHKEHVEDARKNAIYEIRNNKAKQMMEIKINILRDYPSESSPVITLIKGGHIYVEAEYSSPEGEGQSSSRTQPGGAVGGETERI